MKVNENVRLAETGIAGQIVETNFDGQSVTIRAADVSTVEELNPIPRSGVYTGVRSRVYFGPHSVVVRNTAAAVIAAINAALVGIALGGNFALDVSLGKIPGVAQIYKFGKALDADSGVPTDIWDGANATTSQPIWIRPTAARTHDIVSTSVADAAAGTGLRTIMVFGLTDWDTAEVSETITLNGTTNVPTVNPFVIIHRMLGVTAGSGGVNAGDISATAQVDSTLTALMLTGEGQTQMAILGVPSIQTLAAVFFSAAIIGITVATADIQAVIEIGTGGSEPAEILATVFSMSESSGWNQAFEPYPLQKGPAVVKLRAVSNVNNASVSAAFCAYLATN